MAGSNNSAFFEWNATLINKMNNSNVFLLDSPQRIDLADCNNNEWSGSHGLNPPGKRNEAE
jgi:hypothetical protein